MPISSASGQTPQKFRSHTMAMSKQAFAQKSQENEQRVADHVAAAIDLGFAKQAHVMGLSEADYNTLRDLAADVAAQDNK